jgi:hypothetical protein
MLQAIKDGHLITWPGLTEDGINKHLKLTPATAMGHMNQRRQNIWSTSKAPLEKQQPPDTDLDTKTLISANMMIEHGRDDSMLETAEAIAQLATATASDRGMLATLTTANAKLANQLEAAHALIAQLKSEIASLKSKIKPAWQGQRPTKTTNNDSYCWSHGYQVAKSHTSATCNVRKNGHQEAATKIDTMGGVQWGKEWRGGAAKDIDDKLNHFALSLDCTPATTNAPTDDTAILD